MLFIKVRFRLFLGCEWVLVGMLELIGFFLEDPDSCVADMLIAMESRTTRLVYSLPSPSPSPLPPPYYKIN